MPNSDQRAPTSPHNQRFAPLDGLRGLAIAGVFCFHYRIEPISPAQWGWTGVDLFFALSGFLITGILYDSLGEPHYFRNFYIRRSLRIFPLYWGLWLVLVLFMLVKSQFQLPYLAWPAYVGNYLGSLALRRGIDHEHFSILPAAIYIAHERLRIQVAPYWSLCVEEQYYLTWPLVVYLIRKRERLLRFSLAAMAFVLATRIVLHFFLPASWVHYNEVYFWTFTRSDSLLAGSALAMFIRKPGGLHLPRTRFILPLIAAVLAAIALATWRWGLFHGVTFAAWMQTWGLTAIAIIAAGIVAVSLRSPSLDRLLTWKPLQHLGRVSYGFYVFHLLFWDCDRIVIDATRPYISPVLIHAAVFAWVWLLSWASFRFFETPFLKLKERWGGRAEERKAVAQLR